MKKTGDTGAAASMRLGYGRAALPARGQIFVSTALQFGGKAATMLAGLFLVAILTRYLGPAGFGQYTFITGYVSLFAVLTDLGFQAIAVRDMAANRDRTPQIASQLFAIKAATAALAVPAAILLALLLPFSSLKAQGVLLAVALASLGLLAAPLGGTGSAIFQTLVRMGVPVAADVVSRLLMLAAVAALAAGIVAPSPTSGTRLVAVVVVSTAVGFLTSAAVYIAARRIIAIRPLAYNPSLLLPMVQSALPLAFVLVIGILHYRIDVFILTAMKGSVAVGQYGVATKLLDVSLGLAALFIGVAFPVLSARVAGDRVLLQRAFQKALEFLLILGCGVAVFASALAPNVVRLVAGSHFSGAVRPLAIIAWAVPIMFANQVFAHMVVASNRQTRAVPIVLGATALNIALNVLLIPSLGAVGPAIVTDVSEGVNAVGMAILMVRTYGFLPSLDIPARIVASALIAGLVLLLTRQFGLVPAAALGVLIYVGALLLTKALKRTDLTSLLNKEMPS